MKNKIKKILNLALSYRAISMLHFVFAGLVWATGEYQYALMFTTIGWIIHAIAIIDEKDLGVNFNGPLTINHKNGERR